MATASPRGCCSFLCPPGGVYEPVPAACDCACAWVRGGVRRGERAGPALVPRLEPVHAHGARGGGCGTGERPAVALHRRDPGEYGRRYPGVRFAADIQRPRHLTDHWDRWAVLGSAAADG